jgi:hypothetical protein
MWDAYFSDLSYNKVETTNYVLLLLSVHEFFAYLTDLSLTGQPFTET